MEDASSRSELLVEALSLIVLAGYFAEEAEVLSSGLDESEATEAAVSTFIVSSDIGKGFKEKGTGIFLREPAGEPGTDGNDALASLTAGEKANAFETLALDWSTELRRLPGKFMSPPNMLDLDRLNDIVRVNSPGLLVADAPRALVKPAPRAYMSTGLIV